MKNLVNLGLIFLGAYVLIEMSKDGKAKKVTSKPMPTGAVPATPQGTNGVDGLFWQNNPVLMQESICAERAKSVRFPNDEAKYAWIASCSQQYSNAGGAGCASCEPNRGYWTEVQ